MENLRLPKHKILVKRAEAKKVTDGGIEIPVSAQKKQTKGEVLLVGAGLEDELGIDVKVGETVIFNPYSGLEIEIEGEKRLILGADDIILVETK